MGTSSISLSLWFSLSCLSMAGLVKAGGLLDSKTIVHVRRGVEVKCSLKISPHRKAKIRSPKFRDIPRPPKKQNPNPHYCYTRCSFLSQFEVRFHQTNGLEELLMRRFMKGASWKTWWTKKRRLPTCFPLFQAVQVNLVFASHAWPKNQSCSISWFDDVS